MDQRGEPTWQFNVCPRWLLYSGLPQVLGAIVWAVFQALIMLDHQTMLLETRRHGRQRQIFAAPHADLVAMTGLSGRTIKRAVKVLEGSALLAYYRRGRSRQWSHFEINRQTLIELYQYIGPRLRPIQGGIAGLERRELPDRGIRIYGIPKRAINLRWEDLSVMQVWSDPETAADAPDPERIVEICGLPAFTVSESHCHGVRESP